MTQHHLNPRGDEMKDELEHIAEAVHPNPAFVAELEEKLKAAHKPKSRFAFPAWKNILPALGWAAGLTALAFLLNWGIRNLAPIPPQPASGGTATPVAPEPIVSTAAVLPPEGETYNWRGTTLILQAELPTAPSQAQIYEYQPTAPITLEEARAFAAQMGLNGAIYGNPGAYLIVDGDQRLSISAESRFEYYPDYPRYPAWARLGNSPATMPVNAGEQIGQFLQSHGFTFDYVIRPSAVFGGYFVLPLTPDGSPVCHEYFRCAGLLVTLDEQGILSVEGSLVHYAPVDVTKTYEIISAEEALQIVLAANGQAGMIEGMNSAGGPVPTWYRPYPLKQTVTYYGWLSVIPSAEGGAPLVLLDGYPVTGNTANLNKGNESFVAARGRFRTQNGGLVFELESFEPLSGFVDGLLGTIRMRSDGTTVLETAEGETLLLPDPPAGLSLPLENAFVLGVRQGETFDWKSIDLRALQGGGGGGGGGLGFYKLNLSGTPVPFPTPEAAPQFGGGGGESSFQPQRVEALRGTLSITIYQRTDGSQRVDYQLINNGTPFPSLPLAGENLEALQPYQYMPVDVWGVIETRDGQPVLNVERYEIPFPDLGFQILHGQQQSVTLEGQTATLFTATDGTTYVQMSPDGFWVDGSTAGLPGDEVAIEALIVPGESFGGYPAARVFAATMVPQGGPTHELTVTANQIPLYDEPQPGGFTPPTAIVERVELVYYLPDPNGNTDLNDPDARYLQPAWMFSGRYSDGTAFFILVQALKQEYLLPEIAPYTPPG